MTPLESDALLRIRVNFDQFSESACAAGEALRGFVETLEDLRRRRPWRSAARFTRRHGDPAWEPTRAERRAERRRVEAQLRRQRRDQREVEAYSRRQLRAWQRIEHHPHGRTGYELAAVYASRRPWILARLDGTGYVTAPRRLR